jgi:Ca-activated chloride channel homolog
VSFASPIWLALLAALLIRAILYLRDRRTGFAAFEFSSLALAGHRMNARLFFAWIPFVTGIAGLALLTVALARPQHVTIVSDERRGIDIVVVLDSSGSMAAEDFQPKNRFEVAKELISKFIDRRENDRIGIVTFGVRAATRVSITFDREVAMAALNRAKIGDNGDGTAIGHAIATAVNRLRTSRARSRVIILLTDGVNNAGSIDPATAAALAARIGIKIYTIGVGSNGVVPIPIRQQDPLTGRIETVYQVIRADLDEKILQQIAGETGGAYFRATDTRALEDVFQRIDQLEKSTFNAPKTRNVEELYPTPATTGLILIALAAFLGETIWLRLPA